MKKIHQLIVLTTTLGCAGILTAQTASDAARKPHRDGFGKGGPGGRGPGHPIVRVLDTNRDRELSAEEITAAPASLARLDADGDGIIDARELRPSRPSQRDQADAPDQAGRTRPADAPMRTRSGSRAADPVMLALDANANGALEADEIAGAAASLRALDANADGKLTPDELRPLPPTN